MRRQLVFQRASRQQQVAVTHLGDAPRVVANLCGEMAQRTVQRHFGQQHLFVRRSQRIKAAQRALQPIARQRHAPDLCRAGCPDDHPPRK